MEDRKKTLELFAKQLSEGLPFAEDFISGTNDIENNALMARNLSEDALAQQVLKNTGIPIPGKGASPAKTEDFLNRIVAERYPEFKDPNVRLGNEDSYYKKQITIDPKKNSITETVGKALHEAGHKYDDEVLNKMGQNLDLADLRKAKASGLDLKNMDPAQVYELYAKNHHAQIPDLREGTFGLGALKSMMKTGNFKQLAGPVAGLGLGAVGALASGDASAAIPVLDQAENAGESPEEEAQMLAEHNARVNYDNSPARQARLEVLKKLGK